MEVINLKYRNIELTEAEKFKLKVLDAYRNMHPKNVRYLCKLFGIGKSTFYRWSKAYNPKNLASIKYKSRKPKRSCSINWNIVTGICEWKRLNPRKTANATMWEEESISGKEPQRRRRITLVVTVKFMVVEIIPG